MKKKLDEMGNKLFDIFRSSLKFGSLIILAETAAVLNGYAKRTTDGDYINIAFKTSNNNKATYSNAVTAIAKGLSSYHAATIIPELPHNASPEFYSGIIAISKSKMSSYHKASSIEDIMAHYGEKIE